MTCQRCGLHAEVYVSAVGLVAAAVQGRGDLSGDSSPFRGCWAWFLCEGCFQALAGALEEFIWKPGGPA